MTAGFNSGTKAVCAVGFEPNSHLTNYLKQLEAKYDKCGWYVRFQTETAVSNRNGFARFYTDSEFMELGGGILPPDIIYVATKDKVHLYKSVKLIRLAEFLSDTVGSRKIPNLNLNNPPQVVMKMDIEGSEVEVMTDLIFSGSLRFVNVLMVEWHARLQQIIARKFASVQLNDVLEKITQLCRVAKTYDNRTDFCNFETIDIDDESYFQSNFDFPEC
ncbi:uncharacterized protein LOC142348551 isoform X2 [Convolutriloba macropyga]|uniref:uncharacterized protein LOC142348551 isoform X2 n=1 Tax=Convolutriloba macropyga TaxID=536237 RepID=UPI003F51E1B9